MWQCLPAGFAVVAQTRPADCWRTRAEVEARVRVTEPRMWAVNRRKHYRLSIDDHLSRRAGRQLRNIAIRYNRISVVHHIRAIVDCSIVVRVDNHTVRIWITQEGRVELNAFYDSNASSKWTRVHSPASLDHTSPMHATRQCFSVG